jgi:tetratricopeptide (TPR) repeat protein
MTQNNLGNAYLSLPTGDRADNLQRAIACYQEALRFYTPEAAPLDYAMTQNNLGNVYADLGRHADAEAAYRQAIDLDPDDADYHNNLGNVYRVQGRYDEAEAAFRQAIDLNPKDAAFQASYAAICRELGRKDEYKEHIRRARELMANEDDYNKACIEAIAGNAEAALAHLEQALAPAPGLRALAARDPDLEPLHGDRRFEALVGGETKKSDF